MMLGDHRRHIWITLCARTSLTISAPAEELLPRLQPSGINGNEDITLAADSLDHRHRAADLFLNWNRYMAGRVDSPPTSIMTRPPRPYDTPAAPHIDIHEISTIRKGIRRHIQNADQMRAGSSTRLRRRV